MDMEKKTSYRYRLLAAIDSSLAAGKEFAVGRSWGPLVNLGTDEPLHSLILARTSVVALMSRISVGRLKVLAPGEIYEFGPGGGLTGELMVVSDAFWVRLLLQGDLVSILTMFFSFLISGFCRSLHVWRCCLQRFGLYFQSRCNPFCINVRCSWQTELISTTLQHGLRLYCPESTSS